MSAEPDELFTLRNLFWVGNFQSAINEANALNRLPVHLQAEKQEFMYRSYLALGQHHIILSEIKDNSSTSIHLKAVKALTLVIAGQNKDSALQQLNTWLTDPVFALNPSLQLLTALAYLHEENVKDALRALRNPTTMEHHSLLVQIFLRMDRTDLAVRQLKTMRGQDEDHPLSALSGAWVDLQLGRIAEACLALDELRDKHSPPSPSLTSALAVAKMGMGSFEEAEALLQETLVKSPSDPDSLANLITVSLHLSRPWEVTNRYISQLRSRSPSHPILTSIATFDSAFDRVSATLRV